MTFLTPTLAAVAAAIAVPTLVILYFLKLRRRDLEVSSTLLWRRAVQDMQANAPFQRLRRNLLLLLQLIVLGLILFAVAQPERDVDAVVGDRVVLVIDRSASMGARDGPDGATRLEEAKRRALARIDQLREPDAIRRGFGAGGTEADQAMVVAFDDTAAVVQQFTTDKGLLRRAVESITPTDRLSSMRQAFELIKAQKPRRRFTDDAGGTADAGGVQIEVEGLYAGPPLDIRVFTDGRVPDAADVLPAQDDRVVLEAIGDTTSANAGIVELRAERDYAAPARLTVFVGVQSTARAELAAGVELFVDGLPRPIQPLTIPAARAEGDGPPEPARTGLVLTLDQPGAAVITARLDIPGFEDPFGVDNRAWLVVPAARSATLAVVTRSPFLFQRLLPALPLARHEILTPEAFEARTRAEGSAGFDVIVLDGWLPTGPDGAPAPLPPGRWLVLNALPPPLTSEGRTGSTRFLDWERGHPVLRSLTLSNVVLGDSMRVGIPARAPVDVLAQTAQGPAIVEVSGAASRAIVVGFDVANSTWPFDVSFPVFMVSAIDHLRTGTAVGGGPLSSLRPGEILSDRLPPDARDVRVRPPDGDWQALRAGPDGRITYGPLARVGVYAVEWTGSAGPNDAEAGDGRVRRRYAANIADPAESDIATAERIALGDQVVAATAEQTRERRAYWPLLLLGALGIVMLEWYIYNRKVYV